MSATVEASIWLALKARAMTLPLPYPVAWPGETFMPPHSGTRLEPYLRVGRVAADPVRNLIADGQKHTRTGFFLITLVYPLGQDVSVYDQVAGIIADHFRDGTEIRYEGVCVTVTSFPSVQPGFEQDGYWTIPVRIPWRTFA